MKISLWSFRCSVALIALAAIAITPSRSQVSVRLGGGVGLMIPTSGFSGSTLDYYNGSRYGLGSGLDVHGKAKIALSGWVLAGEVDYSSLRNSGNSEPGQGSVEISQKILSLKAGPEFPFGIASLPVTSYIGANVAVNRFSGETTFQGVSKVPSGTYGMKAATRFGLGLTAGTEVSISPFLTFDFNLSYNLMNFAGQTWDNVSVGTNQRIDSYLSLNDNLDPRYVAGDDKHFIASERNIHSLQFTASILFGL
jgi:opacity protein-like surface antigen